MEVNSILSTLQSKFGTGVVSTAPEADIPSAVVSDEIIHEVIGFLKDQGYIFLTTLCGIHYPGQERELGVIYHLHDLGGNRRIRIKTFIPKDRPELPTMTDIFLGANWMERETFDFYGIIFKGHPNLTRILNVEYMDYFPMRKEYPLEDPTREDKDDRFFGR
jgi:NADH-quinone oxidoreductase subunit C